MVLRCWVLLCRGGFVLVLIIDRVPKADDGLAPMLWCLGLSFGIHLVSSIYRGFISYREHEDWVCIEKMIQDRDPQLYGMPALHLHLHGDDRREWLRRDLQIHERISSAFRSILDRSPHSRAFERVDHYRRGAIIRRRELDAERERN